MKRFLKDWTLGVAMAVGTAAYLLFAYTPALEPYGIAMAPFFDAILPVFMFLILFVTFCKVDFNKMRPVRWHLGVGVVQVFFVSVLMGIILLGRLKGNALIFAEAILCCIVSPCAAAAPVVTQKLGGRLEEMTTYTFLSNFITVIFIPVCFPLIEKAGHLSFVQAFLTILYQVFAILVVPMFFAYVVKHFLKPLHRRIVGVKDLSYYLWACSLMIVTGTTIKNICHAQVGWMFVVLIALVGLVLCMVQFSVGRCIGKKSGAKVEAGQALGQKNTAFAIWTAYTYLNPLSSVGPGCYILWQNIVNSIEIWEQRNKQNNNN